MRKFVLVNAQTLTRGSCVVSESAGIRKLKRGSTLLEFITDFMSQFNLSYEILIRGDSRVALADTYDHRFQYTFTEYSELELMRAVALLSRDELLRDIKELLPLKGSL